MKHPDRLTGPLEGVSLEEAAKSVGILTYDKMAEFLMHLSNELKLQSRGDLEKGRKKLSAKLEEASSTLWDVKDHIQEAWRICEPFMRPEPSSQT